MESIDGLVVVATIGLREYPNSMKVIYGMRDGRLGVIESVWGPIESEEIKRIREKISEWVFVKKTRLAHLMIGNETNGLCVYVENFNDGLGVLIGDRKEGIEEINGGAMMKLTDYKTFNDRRKAEEVRREFKRNGHSAVILPFKLNYLED